MARTTRRRSSRMTSRRRRRSGGTLTPRASSTTPPRASPTASATASERRSESRRAVSMPAAPWASTGSSRTNTCSGAAARSWRRTAGKTPVRSGIGRSERLVHRDCAREGIGVPCCPVLSIGGEKKGLSPLTPTGDILTIRQLSEYLMVSEKTIYRMLDKSLLPAVRVGAQWRFRKRDIDAWLDEQVKKVEIGGQKAVLEELAPSEIDVLPLLLPKNVWQGVPKVPRDELLSWIVMHATLDAGVDRQALYESIRTREELSSTALVKDAAFPHPNEPSDFGFKKKRVLLAVARAPVIFNDPNGYRPRVIVVILARTIQGYLLTISRAVKLFGNPALIGRIARSGSSEEVIAAIRDAEERLMASVSR